MKNILFVLSASLFSASSIFAQISPTPVINNEVRDESSIRRRSMELERVKRDADAPKFQENSKGQNIKFAEIKEDFENIQKLQAQIVKTYTSDKQINYKKISDSATEISKRATRLDLNLFLPKTAKNEKIKKEEVKQKSLKDLIIELDNEIGDFINSPIFKNSSLVDSKISEKSQNDLEKIIKLSELLAQEAKNFK